MYEEKDNQIVNHSKDANNINGVDKIVFNGSAPSNDAKQSKDLEIIISNATAKWKNTNTENTLENINLIAKPGRLITVIGPIGAGKVVTYIIIHIISILNMS